MGSFTILFHIHSGSKLPRGLPHAFPTYDPLDTLARLCQKHRSVEWTNLPCVQDIIAKRRNSLFGHVVRLDDHTPAHRALSQVAAARTSSRFGPGWQQRPDARAIHGSSRSVTVHPSAFVLNGPRLVVVATLG